MFDQRLKNVIVLPFTSYCFNFRSFTASQENSKKFPKVRKTSSTFSGLVFSFIFSLISKIRSVLQYFLSATRYNASASRYNPSATRYNPSATRYNASATRYNPSATRYNASATWYNPSATRYNASATRYNPSVSVFKVDFTHIFYITHILPSPIAPSSDLLHIPHNLLPT